MGFLEDVPDSVGFHWADYVVFVLSLAITLGIGIYFACTGGKQSTTREFLFADRKGPLVPVAMSLLATFLSASYILGLPSEVYFSGIIYALYLPIPMILLAIVASVIYIPVFHQLKVTSAYEYFELRFNFGMRIFATLIYYVSMIFFLAIVTYGPALALNVVVGVPLWLCVLVTNLVTTVYTTIGGLKAVIWTDAFQVVVIFSGFIILATLSVRDVGGIDEVYERALQGGRLFWNEFSPDPRIRHTFWGVTIGHMFIISTALVGSQSAVQRYMSLSSTRKAQGSIILWVPLSLISLILIGCIAVAMYAYYAGCDPMLNKKITRPDHMVPYFMIDVCGRYPGLPGVFTAALFSAAMSSVSSIINSLALVTLEDFCKPAYKAITHRDMKDTMATNIAKIIAFILGLAAIGLAYLTPFLGTRLSQITQTMMGLTGGVLLGLFTCGILMPWINSLGAFVGAITSLAFTAWITAGNIMYNKISRIPPSIANCSIPPATTPIVANWTTVWMNLTETTTMSQLVPTVTVDEPLFMELYRLSYKWFGLIACATVVVVANIVSCLSCNRRGLPPLDPQVLFSWKRVIGHGSSKRSKMDISMESGADVSRQTQMSTYIQ